ncbi:hypothetical protein BpHYR1_045922 [Brachionus plicatilis]|uniref:Uncharacterized protein n=1 Tax=Brachionus plicatilis TaxID=10195 RepID=A0A3M7PJR8_BRAPC|nr:hypothetical protein BpHYR1_045922 [Brachionus plicatilis]
MTSFIKGGSVPFHFWIEGLENLSVPLWLRRWSSPIESLIKKNFNNTKIIFYNSGYFLKKKSNKSFELKCHLTLKKPRISFWFKKIGLKKAFRVDLEKRHLYFLLLFNFELFENFRLLNP